MGNVIRDKIVTVANSQKGYKEIGKNITKYSKDFDGKWWQFFNTKKQGAEWCAIFVLWCFVTVIGSSATRKLLGIPAPKNNCAAGVPYLYDYLNKKGLKVSSPAKGDIVILNGKKHVGLVVKVENGKFYTIEGNKGNKVASSSYSVKSSSVSGFFRPKWSTIPDPEPKEEPKTELKDEVKPAPVSTPVKPTTPAYRTYVVKKGDCLWSIASKLLGKGSRYREIKSLNGLKSDLILPNQKLKIPSK